MVLHYTDSNGETDERGKQRKHTGDQKENRKNQNVLHGANHKVLLKDKLSGNRYLGVGPSLCASE